MGKKKKKMEEASNIFHMYNHGGSSATVTPLDLLRIMAEDIERGNIVCNKMIILAVHSEGDDFEVTPYASDMRHSEAISVFEVAKLISLKLMRYIK